MPDPEGYMRWCDNPPGCSPDGCDWFHFFQRPVPPPSGILLHPVEVRFFTGNKRHHHFTQARAIGWSCAVIDLEGPEIQRAAHPVAGVWRTGELDPEAAPVH